MATIGTAYVNVHSGPGPDYPKIAVVEEGEVFPIMGRNPRGDWWLIRLPKIGDGWVSAEWVTAEGPLESVPVIPGE